MFEESKSALVNCPADQFLAKQGEAKAYETLSRLLTRQNPTIATKKE